MNEIISYECSFQGQANNQFMVGSPFIKEKAEPYWLKYTGDICIVDKCMDDDDGTDVKPVASWTTDR